METHLPEDSVSQAAEGSLAQTSHVRHGFHRHVELQELEVQGLASGFVMKPIS